MRRACDASAGVCRGRKALILHQILIHYDPQNVIYFNSLRVSQSYKLVFCSEKRFELAEEMVNTHDELKQFLHRHLFIAK